MRPSDEKRSAWRNNIDFGLCLGSIFFRVESLSLYIYLPQNVLFFYFFYLPAALLTNLYHHLKGLMSPSLHDLSPSFFLMENKTFYRENIQSYKQCNVIIHFFLFFPPSRSPSFHVRLTRAPRECRPDSLFQGHFWLEITISFPSSLLLEEINLRCPLAKQ